MVQGLAQRSLGGAANAEKHRGLGIVKPHVWTARNSFLDVDLNMHMNNASYVYVAELARWHLSGKNGLLHAAFRNKWQFIVGSQAFRYRYAIPPFAQYQVKTTVDAVDDRWMYMTQSFVSTKPGKNGKHRVFAQGTIRAIIMGFDGSRIPPERVFSELGLTSEEIAHFKDTNDLEKLRGFLDWDAGVDREMKQMQE